MGVPMFLWDSVFNSFAIYSEMKSLDRICSSIFNLLEIFHSSWTVLHYCYYSMRTLASPNPSEHSLFSVFLETGHSTEYERLYFNFDLHLSGDELYLISFSVLLGYLCICFGDMLWKSFACFKIRLFLSLLYWRDFLIYSEYQPWISNMVCRCFLPF